eukprot:17113-Heterococcus_DN1.PRE.1
MKSLVKRAERAASPQNESFLQNRMSRFRAYPPLTCEVQGELSCRASMRSFVVACIVLIAATA